MNWAAFWLMVVDVSPACGGIDTQYCGQFGAHARQKLPMGDIFGAAGSRFRARDLSGKRVVQAIVTVYGGDA